ncbi:putative LysR-family transcriptional activator [Pseudomonas knackmussii B13]|uniref:Putative LysR-family transcriptional activator n=1 Tax=Pseudomonas knackmussii (strain DSM 6978 / CCUG 54928 / LMG 23759 / B13) TaxID=1301098 RepID=A0A024HM16_PSEKB|nr:LysR family transcriptional regulator [Pseudomonas knackmussii]CDF85483.1 putative LysR-family transcriptional activator [Pseudomonas knackmussii B13]
MHEIHDLRRIDLNLLVILDALLAERHVSRAADRLAMSQPAVSHALARLRELMGDPLLVRVRNEMRLTSLALELAPRLVLALDGVRGLLGGPAFAAESSHRHFRLGMSDYGAWVVLPRLLRDLRQSASHSSLGVTQESRLEMARQVAEGELDGALGVFPELPAGVRAWRLFEERFVCVCRRDLLDRPLSLSLPAYLAAAHLRVALQDTLEEVDGCLGKLGLQRRVALTLPHFTVAPALLEGTDLVLTIAERCLERLALSDSLAVFEPPLALPRFDFVQIWREDAERDPARLWLRQRLQQAAQD